MPKQFLPLAASLTLADLRQAFSSKDTEENDSTPTALYTAAAPAVHTPTASPTYTGQNFCIFHKTASHSTDECDAVKQLSKEHQDNRKQQRFGNNGARHTGQSANATVELPVSAHAVIQNGQHAHDWICDTAATSHMTPHRGYFIEYRPYRTPIRVAQGALVFSEGVGTILFSNHDGTSLAMADVLHVPSLAFNLFAVFAFMQKAGSTFEGSDKGMTFFREGHTLLRAQRRGNLAYLEGRAGICNMTEQMVATAAEIWHKRLGHLNYDAIKVLHDGDMATGFKVTGKIERCFCEACVLGKQHRDPFPLSNTRANDVLELVHTDLHELPVQSRAGARYWVSFIDDFSRYVWVYPLVR